MRNCVQTVLFVAIAAVLGAAITAGAEISASVFYGILWEGSDLPDHKVFIWTGIWMILAYLGPLSVVKILVCTERGIYLTNVMFLAFPLVGLCYWFLGKPDICTLILWVVAWVACYQFLRLLFPKLGMGAGKRNRQTGLQTRRSQGRAAVIRIHFKNRP